MNAKTKLIIWSHTELNTSTDEGSYCVSGRCFGDCKNKGC